MPREGGGWAEETLGSKIYPARNKQQFAFPPYRLSAEPGYATPGDGTLEVTGSRYVFRGIADGYGYKSTVDEAWLQTQNVTTSSIT